MNAQTQNRNVALKPSQEFLNGLAEMHTAERELTLALPLITKAAKSADLKTLLNLHLEETKGHVKTIEAVAESLKIELPKKKSKKMASLIKEGVKVLATKLNSTGLDAHLIAVGQKIEQYEIAAYTPLCAQAEATGYEHELALLTSTLNQEKLANELLAGLAAGKKPLKELIEQTSLKMAGATFID
jgi:ferritin-like metal-binding protein YciE